MTEPPLIDLIRDTETQLTEALAAVAAGALVDLGDLVPRIEALCRQAVTSRNRAAAPLLAGLISQLDALDRALRERIAAIGSDSPAPTPRRASALYRAAANPASGESQE